MPSASPEPVPTTAINRVPRTTPPRIGGIFSVTKCVSAIFAGIPGCVARIYSPTRMPPMPMGGTINALRSAPFLADFVLSASKIACA